MPTERNTRARTIPWVAEQLGISTRQVYRLIHGGELVKMIVGKRSARITDESYQAYFRRSQEA